VKDIQQNWF